MAHKNKQTGFTVVELLIVIVVIGILAAITITVFSGMQGRARDSQRTADAKLIVQALEQYKLINGRYPPIGESGMGSQWGWESSAREAEGQFIAPLRPGNFPSGVPVDPINDAIEYSNIEAYNNGHHGYNYYVYPAGASGCDASRGRYFIFGIINMETSADVHPDSPGFSCPSRNWENEFEWVTGGYEN